MKRVLAYTKHFIKPMIIGPAFKIVETFFELLTPLIMAKLIDEGIPYQNNTIILQYGLILGLFALFGYCFAMFCQYLAARTQERYGSALRHDLFAHIQSLSLAKTQLIGVNSLVTRLTIDIYQIQAAVATFMRIAPRAPFLLIGSTFMTFLIQPELSLIFLLIIPLIFAIFTLIMYYTLPMYQKIQQKIDELSLLTNENLTGARVIRSFSKQQEQNKKFYQETSILKDFSLYAGKFEAFLNPTTQIIVNLAIAAIIYFAKFDINQGKLTQGDLIAIINYIMQISLALVILVNFVITFSRAYTSGKRIEEVFNLTPETTAQSLPHNDTQGTQPALILENVSFTYPDALVPVLDNISFSLQKEATLGIIGSTGSGKSTLIRLLGKLYQPTAGTILLDGIPLEDYPDAILHQKLQIVFQQATLFRGTIAENLRMGNLKATDEQLWQALNIAQAQDFVQEKPQGLQTIIEQGGQNLSGGQRQRLTIARSLVVQPDTIIFDDTSSALDYVTDSRLRHAISKLPMTKIIVSQRIHAIKDCDQIIVLEQGNISGLGTHTQLLQTNTIYQTIAQSQKSLKGE